MSALDLLSDWSSFTHISISDKQWQEGNTGRYYYRHPTEPGTVIGWHDIGTNADVELLVFDAVKRRADLVWVPSTAYTDSTLPNIADTNINSTRSRFNGYRKFLGGRGGHLYGCGHIPEVVGVQGRRRSCVV